MELRWYQTFNKFGRDSDVSLQFRDIEDDEWKDVESVREFKKDEE